MNIVELLSSKKLTISSAESFTGGLFASLVTDNSGASSVFKGGIVCYTNEIKINVLGVNKDIIDEYGAVSKQCAESMVINCQKLFKSHIAVSFTGNAGPTASENKKVGEVYIGILINNDLNVYELELTGHREEIKQKACTFILDKIREKI